MLHSCFLKQCFDVLGRTLIKSSRSPSAAKAAVTLQLLRTA